MIGQLDKCLREASTLDGVLEFRNEHFWTIAFGTMVSFVVFFNWMSKVLQNVAHTSPRLDQFNLSKFYVTSDYVWN